MFSTPIHCSDLLDEGTTEKLDLFSVQGQANCGLLNCIIGLRIFDPHVQKIVFRTDTIQDEPASCYKSGNEIIRRPFVKNQNRITRTCMLLLRTLLHKLQQQWPQEKSPKIKLKLTEAVSK